MLDLIKFQIVKKMRLLKILKHFYTIASFSFLAVFCYQGENANKALFIDFDRRTITLTNTLFLSKVSKLIYTNFGELIPKIILIFSHQVKFLRYLLLNTFFTLKLEVFLYTVHCSIIITIVGCYCDVVK